MKNYLSFVIILLLPFGLFSQTPESVNYQAVLRDNNANIISSQNISLQFSILSGSANGTPVYVEAHQAQTNTLGLVNLEIGSDTSSLGNFSTIDWGSNEYWLQVELDENGGSNYTILGSSKFISVPYALHAKTAEAATNDGDTDPSNELQQISISSDTLYLSNGGIAILPQSVVSTDDQVVSISNDTLFLEDGGFVKLPAGFSGDYNDLNNTPTNLSNFNNDLGFISSPIDADADSTNELQTLSISSDTIFLSDGGSVILPQGVVSTDDQVISISNDTLFLEDGGFVKLPAGFSGNYNDLTNAPANLSNFNNDLGFVSSPIDADADSTNELQTLSISSDTIFLSDGGSVILPAGTVNTDDQVVSISNDTIFLEDGGFVKLPAGFSGDYNDLSNTPTNLSNFNNDLGFVTRSTDADADSTNEIQLLSISDDTIFLSDGGSVILPVSASAGNNLTDTDNDTKIQVEESADEDVIRFDIGGTEAFRMKQTTGGFYTLEVLGSSEGVFIGRGAGNSVTASNNRNTMVGDLAGNANTGLLNTMLGYNAGRNNTGNGNTFLGCRSGVNASGGFNVFIGTEAGSSVTGSNKLYIENSSSATPLIYGEFDNDILTVNGDLGVGTSSIDAKLHVNSAATGESTGVKLTQGIANSLIYHNSGNDLVLRKQANADQLVLDSDGNVGVGTSNPTQKLHVNGSIRMVDGNQSNGHVAVSSSTGVMSWTDPSNIIAGGVEGTHESSSSEQFFVSSNSGWNLTSVAGPAAQGPGTFLVLVSARVKIEGGSGTDELEFRVRARASSCSDVNSTSTGVLENYNDIRDNYHLVSFHRVLTITQNCQYTMRFEMNLDGTDDEVYYDDVHITAIRLE